MKNAGFSRKKIVGMVQYLHSAFNDYTVEETEEKWKNW